jgi:hypothetical protein
MVKMEKGKKVVIQYVVKFSEKNVLLCEVHKTGLFMSDEIIETIFNYSKFL